MLDPRALREAIMDETSESGFSGVVLVEQDGRPVVSEARGYANRSDLIPNGMDTRFGIASGGKGFTAVAVYQLIEQGVLSLETAVGDMLDIPLGHVDPKVTVAQLLTHTSGIPDYFDEDVDDDYGSIWDQKPVYLMLSPKDFLPLFSHEKMNFEPGAQFRYSNSGFIMLGMILESVTGRPFAEHVTESVLRKAGMANSGYFRCDRLPSKCAVGYIDEPGAGWRSNVYSLPIIGGGDGGTFVTAEDMLRFWTALFQNRLLSPKGTADLLSPHAKVGDNLSYGYGVWIGMRGEPGASSKIRRFSLMGEDPGVNFSSAVYPEAGIRTAILANAGRVGHRIARKISELVG